MKIGIDASRAFLKQRTGIEEYSYQVIDGLKAYLQNEQVILYIRSNQSSVISHQSFNLPKNWKIKIIRFPRFWTQLGLSLEMLLHPVDVLFVPAHTVPIIHPKHTVVTVHGLEYEFCPNAYSFWERIYMRCSIKNSCKWTSRIISVSENTKKDLIALYNVSAEKIKVVYEGYSRGERNFQFPISNFQSNPNDKISKIFEKPYLLFVGRIEERKNISNVVKAFEILKEKYNIPHKLVLAGKPGYGYENLKSQISNLKSKDDILELGFVSEDEKWELLKNAEVFVFPTLYEGFGIPILEAQSVGCSIVASNNSSVPEVTSCYSEQSEPCLPADRESRNIMDSEIKSGILRCTQDDTCSALLVDPQSPEDIAKNIHKIISNETLKNAIIAKGLENVQRFSWEKCSQGISKILLKKN